MGAGHRPGPHSLWAVDGVTEQALDNHDVAPHIIELSVTAIERRAAKTACLSLFIDARTFFKLDGHDLCHRTFRYSRSALFSEGVNLVPHSWPHRLLPELRALQSVVT